MKRLLFTAAMVVMASAAAAQTGASPTRTDLTPAAPTARSGPDAGQTREYPPNTAAILPPESRTPNSGRGDEQPQRPASAAPDIPGLSNKPVEQVGK